MPDREKVINDLQDAVNDDWMWQHADYYALTMEKALALLKEQEPVEPNVSDINDHDAHGSWWYQCGKCKMPIDYGDRFCRRCGRAVKWDA